MRFDRSSRGYLQRAVAQIKDGRHEALIYAALELRCGIEARLQEYAEPWDRIPEAKKREWAADKLHKNLERAFGLGEKYVRVEMRNLESKQVIGIFYYTPVTSTLRQDAGILGNHVHAKAHKADDDPYWNELRNYLMAVAFRLKTANSGTMLGPMLEGGISESGLAMNFNIELLNDTELHPHLVTSHSAVELGVSYPDNLPDSIEPEAHIWTP